MADFTPIMTQEDFDTAISARLARERATAIKPYADYDEIKNDLGTAQNSLAVKDATIADLTAQLQTSKTDLAKTRIALEKGLPQELAARLTGANDDELRSDADTLLALLGSKRTAEPAKSTEPAKSVSSAKNGNITADFRSLLNNLNLGGN